MDVNTTGLAVRPPADASPVVRAPAPRTSPAPEPARPDTDTLTDTPDSATLERLRQRSRANTASGVRLQVNETVDRVIAQIVNDSNEVIKQIPPEDAVRAFTRFREVTGLIFDLEI